MNSQDKVTSKPPKHNCTAEIIAELERLVAGTKTPKEAGIKLQNRLIELKAKETQL